jgi:hypothetical protein
MDCSATLKSIKNDLLKTTVSTSGVKSHRHPPYSGYVLEIGAYSTANWAEEEKRLL